MCITRVQAGECTDTVLLNMFSADTFTLLPIDQLGMSYVAVGTIERIDLPNVIMAVAYHDATEVLLIIISTSQ